MQNLVISFPFYIFIYSHNGWWCSCYLQFTCGYHELVMDTKCYVQKIHSCGWTHYVLLPQFQVQLPTGKVHAPLFIQATDPHTLSCHPRAPHLSTTSPLHCVTTWIPTVLSNPFGVWGASAFPVPVQPSTSSVPSPPPSFLTCNMWGYIVGMCEYGVHTLNFLYMPWVHLCLPSLLSHVHAHTAMCTLCTWNMRMYTRSRMHTRTHACTYTHTHTHTHTHTGEGHFLCLGSSDSCVQASQRPSLRDLLRREWQVQLRAR